MNTRSTIAALILLIVLSFAPNANARWYNAETGTFLTRDSAGYRDGMNLYTYVGDRPIVLGDPMGLTSSFCFHVSQSDPEPAKTDPHYKEKMACMGYCGKPSHPLGGTFCEELFCCVCDENINTNANYADKTAQSLISECVGEGEAMEKSDCQFYHSEGPDCRECDGATQAYLCLQGKMDHNACGDSAECWAAMQNALAAMQRWIDSYCPNCHRTRVGN